MLMMYFWCLLASLADAKCPRTTGLCNKRSWMKPKSFAWHGVRTAWSAWCVLYSLPESRVPPVIVSSIFRFAFSTKEVYKPSSCTRCTRCTPMESLINGIPSLTWQAGKFPMANCCIYLRGFTPNCDDSKVHKIDYGVVVSKIGIPQTIGLPFKQRAITWIVTSSWWF